MIRNLAIYSGILWGMIVSLAPLSTQAGFTRPIIFPVNGPYSFQDDFSDPRSGGTREHLGNDIISKKMTPVVAVVDGRITTLVSPQASWGYAIVIKDAEDYAYWYLHLNNDSPGTDDGLGGEANAYAPGLSRGSQVVKGQLIGWVGDSGNAESTVSHLHFEMHTPDGGAFNPYESLLAASPVPAVTASPQTGIVTVTIPDNYRLIKYSATPAVYLLADNIKYQIADGSTFVALGFSWAEISTISNIEQYQSGPTLEIGPNLIIQRAATGSPAPTSSTSSKYIFTKTLVMGSTGEEVRQLQIRLKSLGYFLYPTATGYYGTFTKDAVIRFQKAKGLVLTGTVDASTRAALNR